jgi:hypothetical protein
MAADGSSSARPFNPGGIDSMAQVHTPAPAETVIHPDAFDGVSVVEAVVSGPGTTNRLYTVTGVALMSGLSGAKNAWKGYDVYFMVPAAGQTVPVEDGGKPFLPGVVQSSAVTVVQGTFANTTGSSAGGWGVDSASCAASGDMVQVKARVVVMGDGAGTYRLTFNLGVAATR